ncbi:MAG: hypothetical protein ABMA01_18590, partial [Chthoniobacteraceae bacterium]
ALVRYEGDPVASVSTDNWSWYYAYAWTAYMHYASNRAYYLGLANYFIYTGYGEYYRHLGAANPRTASSSFWKCYGNAMFFFHAHRGDFKTGAALLNAYHAYAASFLK